MIVKLGLFKVFACVSENSEPNSDKQPRVRQQTKVKVSQFPAPPEAAVRGFRTSGRAMRRRNFSILAGLKALKGRRSSITDITLEDTRGVARVWGQGMVSRILNRFLFENDYIMAM